MTHIDIVKQTTDQDNLAQLGWAQTTFSFLMYADTATFPLTSCRQCTPVLTVHGHELC